MKQLLNTLYVTSPNSYLHKDGTNLVIDINGKEAGRIPVHNLQQVVCFGYNGASTGAMHLCVENSVTLTFMKANGRFLASVHGETKGNVLLRRAQYRTVDNEEASLKIARNMIEGKILNCRAILRKGLSNHPDTPDSQTLQEALQSLTTSIASVQSVKSFAELRGVEGDAARTYFSALDGLILRNKDSFFMNGRTRRPPKDMFNSVLSFLYALLMNDVRSSLEAVGLDPYVGVLHTDRPGRPSLALDMMEEFRPIADRVALRLVNLGMINKDGFINEGGGSYMMNDQTRAVVIGEWQKTKSQEMYHHFIEDKVQTGILPHIQSMLLAKCIRGDLDGYPPYIIKQAKP